MDVQVKKTSVWTLIREDFIRRYEQFKEKRKMAREQADEVRMAEAAGNADFARFEKEAKERGIESTKPSLGDGKKARNTGFASGIGAKAQTLEAESTGRTLGGMEREERL